jgi:hypothetical protein
MIDTKTYLKLHSYAAAKSSDSSQELNATLLLSEDPPRQPFTLLLPTEIKGYNLQTKKWGQVATIEI